MSFSLRNLSVLAYANGFTLWHYRAGDEAMAALETETFFTNSGDLMAAGDFVLASGTNGTRIGAMAKRGEALVLAPIEGLPA